MNAASLRLEERIRAARRSWRARSWWRPLRTESSAADPLHPRFSQPFPSVAFSGLRGLSTAAFIHLLAEVWGEASEKRTPKPGGAGLGSPGPHGCHEVRGGQLHTHKSATVPCGAGNGAREREPLLYRCLCHTTMSALRVSIDCTCVRACVLCNMLLILPDVVTHSSISADISGHFCCGQRGPVRVSRLCRSLCACVCVVGTVMTVFRYALDQPSL